jgi:SAM-dependent methyltransferase
MIEEIRNYWDRRPCNIRHSSAPVRSQQWSEEVTERKYFVEPHIPEFAKFDKWKDKIVLEIGCGIGTDTLEFLKEGAYVDAVELSPESYRLASNRCKSFERGAFYCVNSENWLPDRKYDLIYSFGVLHHTPSPEKVLYKAHKRLVHGGELRVMLYAKWSIKNLLGEQPEAQAGCPLARVYSVNEAKKLVESCGFKVKSITKTHIFPWKIEDYVRYRYVKRWYYAWMPKKLFSWLESKLGWHLLIVATK